MLECIYIGGNTFLLAYIQEETLLYRQKNPDASGKDHHSINILSTLGVV